MSGLFDTAFDDKNMGINMNSRDCGCGSKECDSRIISLVILGVQRHQEHGIAEGLLTMIRDSTSSDKVKKAMEDSLKNLETLNLPKIN